MLAESREETRLLREEVEELRAALQPSAIRYGWFDTAAEQMAVLGLYRSVAEAQKHCGPSISLVTVLLPTA